MSLFVDHYFRKDCLECSKFINMVVSVGREGQIIVSVPGVNIVAPGSYSLITRPSPVEFT